MPLSLAAARELFPITRERIYLEAGGTTPLSRPTRERLERFLEEWAALRPDRVERWDEEYQAARAAFAALIGADADEVLFTENTSYGLNLVAEMLPVPAGSNVVYSDLDHWNAVWPWKLREGEGLELRCVRSDGHTVPPEAIAAAVDDRTVAVIASQVSFSTGYRQDVRAVSEIAHRHGAFLIVDGAQASGVLATDVHRDQVDFLACPSYKWLLGPPSGGFLYVARRHHERLRPPHVGLSAVELPYRFDAFTHRPAILRFQTGFLNYLGAVAVRPGLELLAQVGLEQVEAHVERLVTQCLDGLAARGFQLITPRDPRRRAGVIAAVIDHPDELVRYLAERRIDVGVWEPERQWRPALPLYVCPHLYNTAEEIDALLAAIDDWQRPAG
jgi:selenocysteine lyase/cysteine desulfurase